MSNFPPNTTGERDAVKDNARKFIKTRRLSREFLKDLINSRPGATVEGLAIEWIDTRRDNETKVVMSTPLRFATRDDDTPPADSLYSKVQAEESSSQPAGYEIPYEGKITYKIIEKTTDKDGNRHTKSAEIPEDEYDATLKDYPAIKIVDKIRHTFTFVWESVEYKLKYDIFLDEYGELTNFTILEVEASDDALDAFDPDWFATGFKEVSGQPEYTGYRVADTLNKYMSK